MAEQAGEEQIQRDANINRLDRTHHVAGALGFQKKISGSVTACNYNSFVVLFFLLGMSEYGGGFAVESRRIGWNWESITENGEGNLIR
ncbi:hypothetical protein PIB30_067526 [Stylosanthes scabra]|uniref:Uncharacterized protein n=1 Tax=Stylosanthes scabra TaxID=79078 RepID=A0ABU6YKT1_9FABA|nr:hypothetical protein [Stylosanthes scabra]